MHRDENAVRQMRYTEDKTKRYTRQIQKNAEIHETYIRDRKKQMKQSEEHAD